jgi:MerR family transcriptional regulator, redox-sensitive transcriptional activator SoxR
MPQLTISEVARQVGLRASAIRYYEEIGILPAPTRSSGQRRYDQTVLHRLAVIQRARQTGFTLTEIRELFFGFREGTPASQRWRKLSQRKMAELDKLSEQIRSMQEVLRRLQGCKCNALDECGRGIFRKGDFGVRSVRASSGRGC